MYVALYHHYHGHGRALQQDGGGLRYKERRELVLRVWVHGDMSPNLSYNVARMHMPKLQQNPGFTLMEDGAVSHSAHFTCREREK